MDYAERFNKLSPNKQLLLADRLSEQVHETSTGTGRPDTQRLVAYVVPAPGQSPTNHQIRQFLKLHLPDYMIPEAFVPMSALTLTPNGKVDRKSLTKIARGRSDVDVDYVAPRTDLEEELARIWAGVLRVERVSIFDNFFELGGHSLLATRLMSRLRESFKIDLPLRSLFETPTVAGLAVTMVQYQLEQVNDEEAAAILAEFQSPSP